MSWRGAIVATGGVVIVTAATGIGIGATIGYPWDNDGSTPGVVVAPLPSPAWAPADVVLTTSAVTPQPTAPPMIDVVGPPAGVAELGGRVGVSVAELTTGTSHYGSGSTVAQTPASTLKILTSVAALRVWGAEHTFTTRVVTSAAGLVGGTADITLVGGGDPTLTTGEISGRTQLAVLADDTVAALTAAGSTSVRLTFDDSLFSGPAVDPDWNPTFVSSDIVSPVSALAVDLAEERPADPATDATAVFADLLRARGVVVEGEPARAAAATDAVDVAAVRSAPLATIVEDIMATSDNDGAEALARHVAVGIGRPGTSVDASAAVVETLIGLGVDMSTARVLDGSGLARANAVSAATLTATLVLAADPAHPDLRPVITGLPVAGFSGTVADRFADVTGAEVGAVRAKTGTLTGVSGLAGVVVAADGTSYAFTVLADDVDDTSAARDALDDVATAIAGCGCG